MSLTPHLDENEIYSGESLLTHLEGPLNVCLREKLGYLMYK